MLPRSHYELAKLIFQSCMKLKTSIETTYSSLIILHTYSYSELELKFGDDPIEQPPELCKSNNQVIILVSSILFLSGKATENFRTIREIFVVVLRLCGYSYEIDEDKFILMNERIVEREHNILKALCFSAEFISPYSYLCNLSRYANMNSSTVQLAWTILNDIILHKEIRNIKPVCILYIILNILITSYIHFILTYSFHFNIYIFFNFIVWFGKIGVIYCMETRR